jgi:linoleoyl-CoA desaturase
VAIQHLRLDKLYKGKLSKAEVRPLIRQFNAKILRQWGKDYLFFPLLALLLGANALAVLVGNAGAH